MSYAPSGSERSSSPRARSRAERAEGPEGLPEAVVGGVPVAVTTFQAAVEWLHDRTVRPRGGVDVRLVNAYSIVSVHRDAGYLELVRSSGISLPDGAPVLAALRLLRGRREAGRVRGPSFFESALEEGARAGVREFFLGTTDSTLSLLVRRAHDRWPTMQIAGTWAPPFTKEVDEAFVQDCADRIRGSKADRVWVALGTPKQDHVASRLAAVLDVPCIAVGAAFDFLAGTKREAPAALQRVGGEWVFRLLSEPRRLWRRYLIGNAVFIGILLREAISPRESLTPARVRRD